ncbi:MAG: hypothetical protein H6585_08360 [Flavobacteriales bacterium]|nr:hypothetical protein [Flavobacteriales bacterium]MCB9448341.1 hypothetical protein [Flavobacteriales bacterium]
MFCAPVAGPITVTLPAAASNTGRIYYIKKTDGTPNTITIDGNGAETIDGATTLVLYVQYDAVRIYCNGSNWYILEDQIHPHMCKLRRSTAQTINNSTYTNIAFNTEDYDVGNIGDITTDNRVEIQRDGLYQITATWITTAVMDDNEEVTGYIQINGTRYTRGLETSGGTNFILGSTSSVTLELSAGDYIDFEVWQNEGSSITTSTTNDQSNPCIQVREIR